MWSTNAAINWDLKLGIFDLKNKKWLNAAQYKIPSNSVKDKKKDNKNKIKI